MIDERGTRKALTKRHAHYFTSTRALVALLNCCTVEARIAFVTPPMRAMSLLVHTLVAAASEPRIAIAVA